MNDAYLNEFEEQGGYLNFASVGPASKSARKAPARLLDALAVGDRPVPAIIEPAYSEARATIASGLGVEDRFATSVPSTGAGIMQVAFGLIGAGGNVVVPSHEFPANRYPWLRAEAAGGPEVRAVEIPDGRLVPEALAPAIDAETRLVAVSLVDYMTGFRVDPDAIVEAAGDALVLVDGIQGFGAVEAGLGAADVFVAGGQKWLRGGLGAGVNSSLPSWWRIIFR